MCVVEWRLSCIGLFELCFCPSQHVLYSLSPLCVWYSESYPVYVCLSGVFSPVNTTCIPYSLCVCGIVKAIQYLFVWVVILSQSTILVLLISFVCVLVWYSESYLALVSLSGAVCPSQQFLYLFPLCVWYSESYFALLNQLLAETTNDTVSWSRTHRNDANKARTSSHHFKSLYKIHPTKIKYPHNQNQTST